MNVLALRLSPGDDLRRSLTQFADTHAIEAGFILSAVGSLTQAAIRFAGQDAATILDGKFEILSLSGTLSRHGSHLHITCADPSGRVVGGHLTDGTVVYTTAEIVVGTTAVLVFRREVDAQTGFSELVVLPAF